ncbi:MAG: hypothetical protein V4857_00290 [Pseudomonadota bacterium]
MQKNKPAAKPAAKSKSEIAAALLAAPVSKPAAKPGAKPAAKAAAKPAAKPKPAPAKDGDPVAKLTSNPFLDADMLVRMRDYTERDAALGKELRAIDECGAGRKSPDPRRSPALKPLLALVKKGLKLSDMFDRIVAGTEKGLWEGWLATYGLEILDVNYGPGPRNARIALDLTGKSKANALFANAGVPNWRSVAAEDCASVRIENINDTPRLEAVAVFVLDPAPK